MGPHVPATMSAIDWLGQRGAFTEAVNLSKDTSERLTAQGSPAAWEVLARGTYWRGVGTEVDQVRPSCFACPVLFGLRPERQLLHDAAHLCLYYLVYQVCSRIFAFL